MSGSGEKPMTNPWFAYVNLSFGDQNPGFEVKKPGFARNPRFVQTRDQPMTNPWFTRDNPWFFSRVETLKSRWFFSSFFHENFDLSGWSISRNSSRFKIAISPLDGARSRLKKRLSMINVNWSSVEIVLIETSVHGVKHGSDYFLLVMCYFGTFL